jgi:hypothetical protein
MNAIILNEIIEGMNRIAFGGMEGLDGWIAGLEPCKKEMIVKFFEMLLRKMKPLRQSGRPKKEKDATEKRIQPEDNKH